MKERELVKKIKDDQVAKKVAFEPASKAADAYDAKLKRLKKKL